MANSHAIESHMQNNDPTKIPVAVVMVPPPAQGHLNQLLHLCRLVSAYDIPVHFVGTATHNRQAQTLVHGWDPQTVANIKFHDLESSGSNPLQDPDSFKCPTFMVPLLKSSMELRPLVYNFVGKLSATVGKVVVIYDSMIPYVVQDICSVPNAKSYCFQSISAFSLYSFSRELEGQADFPPEAPIVKEVPSFEGCYEPDILEFSKFQNEIPKSNSGDLYNTSRVIESLYLDLLAKEKITGTDKNWAIGPFNPVSLPKKDDSVNRHKSLDWLDKQELNSVIFVCFGGSSLFSYEQIKEIAFGLERSEQKFIWKLSDADKGGIFAGKDRKADLPEGFEERIQGRGIIVRDWAPQLEILGHPSTGGFISHCGWNSCMESISMGVPIATWPIHFDQPRNAFLVTRVLKIGVELKDWERRDEVISSDRVEKAVRTLLDSAEGDEIRKRATELGDAVKKSMMEGGVTRKEMDSFIAHMSK
ncbi:hypothetical protein BUALT_Bualt12G0019200 [Buddleja alternifolia]|uniref:Glycosyltransferase n=1 Tax=Buddleja alternifolia TaxID=168488 RepID=A0AAV6WYD1_9LAMI|nr:hypothetical protein BUALT_Bualt12G0019200 [Buddleja alternifolia]